MDHYNEQLIQKQTETKDVFLRLLIAIGTVLVIAACVFAAYVFGFTLLIVIAAGGVYLAYLLFSGTFVEYEYIVTNNDLDIDKITGKRKRKRLITLKLNKVKQWGEYTGNEGRDVSATVMASDATGHGAWYIIVDHDKLGKVMVILTPSETTIANINFGVPYAVKKKLEFEEKAEEEEEETE